MTTNRNDPLTSAARGVLVTRTADDLAATPVAVWYDGAGVWMAAVPSPATDSLRNGGEAAVWVRSVQPGAPGVAVWGRCRVFGLHDPVGLVTHAGPLSAALAALAARTPDVVVGYVEDAVGLPPRLPRNRVVLRLRVTRLRGVDEPEPGPGIAPPLPAVVPSDVRRQVSGERCVVAAAASGRDVDLAPGVWDANLRLTDGEGRVVGPADVALVIVETASGVRGGRMVGLALAGRLDGHGMLHPQRASWWDGLRQGSAEIPAPTPGGVDLPE
jgi:hypothetical protein